MVVCLERGADLHMAQLMPLSLASVKSRLILPFCYRLTRVVPEKGPLNGCVCVCVFKLLETIEHSLNVSKSNCNFMMLACMMTMAQNRPLWRLMSTYGATHS